MGKRAQLLCEIIAYTEEPVQTQLLQAAMDSNLCLPRQACCRLIPESLSGCYHGSVTEEDLVVKSLPNSPKIRPCRCGIKRNAATISGPSTKSGATDL